MELSQNEIKTMRVLVAHPNWLSIKSKWMMDFTRSTAVNEADLIRNAVGFDAWQKCIARFESYADETVKIRREKDDGLEYVSPAARPE